LELAWYRREDPQLWTPCEDRSETLRRFGYLGYVSCSPVGLDDLDDDDGDELEYHDFLEHHKLLDDEID